MGTESVIAPCIYCGTDNPSRFKGREHVVPQAFGKFGGQTPVLKCVCDDCNSHFGRELDPVLARDTIDGIARYRSGLFSREQHRQKRITFKLTECAENGEWGGVLLDGIDPLTGELRLPRVPQVVVFNRDTKAWDSFFGPDFSGIASRPDVYGATGEMRIKAFAASKEDHAALAASMRASGIEVRSGAQVQLPRPVEQTRDEGRVGLLVDVEGEMDDVHKRALAKILVNFAAKYIGEDEVRRDVWLPIRRFVRFGEGLLSTRFSERAFWTGQEDDERRFAPGGINIRVENNPRGIVGVIQFFDSFLYECILVPDAQLALGSEKAYRFVPGAEPIAGARGQAPR